MWINYAALPKHQIFGVWQDGQYMIKRKGGKILHRLNLWPSDCVASKLHELILLLHIMLPASDIPDELRFWNKWKMMYMCYNLSTKTWYYRQ